MAPTKGKQATKGQKQIYEENKETIKFYGIMSIGAEAIYLLVMTVFFMESFTFFYWCLVVLTVAIYAGVLQFMTYMAKATFSESGALLDGGIDLNMQAGISEHLKDLVILTAAVQILSLITNYFWLLWLVAPIRGFYMLWTSLLSPWFFQAAPEVDEKKQKKMERKMAKRH